MQEIQAPHLIPETEHTSIFLAGSIEMGKAENWQTTVIQAMEPYPGILLNPRRDDWDSSWEQCIEHPQFYQQVNWELQAMEQADQIVLNFDAATKSPITLLELGLHARTNKMIVCCPEGFWRKGNVDIVCERYQIQVVTQLSQLIRRIQQYAL